MRENLTAADAWAFVADRTAVDHMRRCTTELGGGWKHGFDAWRGSGMEYLLLVAPTRKRIKRRAPLAILAADCEGLRAAAKVACSQLSDVKCCWVMPMTEEAQAVVRDEILADTVPQGRA